MAEEKTKADINVEDISQVTSMLSKSVYGTTNEVSDENASIINDFDKALNLLNTSENEISSSNILEIATKNKKDSEESMSTIRDMFEEDQDISQFNSLFRNNLKQLDLYDNYHALYSLLPQIKLCVDTMTENILSPDDYSKSVVLKPKTLEKDTFDPIVERLKLEKKFKTIVNNTLKIGKQYVHVPSYKDYFNRYINKKAKENDGSSKRFKNVSNFSESVLDIKLSESNTANKAKVAGAGTVESLYKFYNESVAFNDKYVTDNEMNLLIEASMDLPGYINLDNVKDGDLIKKFKDAKKNKPTSGSDGFVSVGEDGKAVKQVEELLGCSVRLLDIEKVYPIKVGEVCLGYYYVEVEDIRSTVKAMNDPMSKMRGVGNKSDDSSNSMELINKLSEVLMSSIDADFIKQNAEFKEFIYSTIENTDHSKSKYKISYIEPSEVFEFSIDDGVSVLDRILFTGTLYLSLLYSNVLTKLTRGFDKRIVYVKEGISNNIYESVMSAAKQFKQDSFGLHNQRIYSLFNKIGKGHDIFMATGNDDQHPMDFEVLSGQDVEIRDDFMEQLDAMNINALGVPTGVLGYRDDVDFAKSLTMSNSKFLKTIISKQSELQPTVTAMMRRIVTLETGVDCVDDFLLPAPASLNMSNMLDLFSNTFSMAENVMKVVIGDNEENNKVIDSVFGDVVKDLMPTVDWAKYDKIVKSARVKANKPDADADADDDSY